MSMPPQTILKREDATSMKQVSTLEEKDQTNDFKKKLRSLGSSTSVSQTLVVQKDRSGRLCRRKHKTESVLEVTSQGKQVVMGEEFEVEAILGHQKSNDGYLYLLKWKGYSESDNTWEPSSNLFCTDLLNAYQKKHNLKSYTKDSSTNLPDDQSQAKIRKKDTHRKLDLSTELNIVSRSFKGIDVDASSIAGQKSQDRTNGEIKRNTVEEKTANACESDSWCVQASNCLKKLSEWKKEKRERREKRRVKELKVTIYLKNGVSFFHQACPTSAQDTCAISSTKHENISSTLSLHTTQMNDEGDNVHILRSIHHDHTYSAPLLIEPVISSPYTVMTPPSSSEPPDKCISHSPTIDNCPIQSSHVYEVEISPPISPSFPNHYMSNHHPIPERESQYEHSYSKLPLPLNSNGTFHLTDGSSRETTLSPLISSDPMKLYLSPTSSTSSDLDVCTVDEDKSLEDVFSSAREGEPKNHISPHSYPNRILDRKTVSHQALKLRGEGKRWRKGPAPLPRSFSKRHSGSSLLHTKAAKLQYSELVTHGIDGFTSVNRHENKPHSNGYIYFKKSNHHNHKDKRLSLSLKSTRLQFDHVRTKLNVSSLPPSPNDENHLQQLSSQSSEPCKSIMKLNFDDLPFEYSSICAYKEQLMNWQYELNKQRDGTDDIIYVENELDMTPPPDDFSYICSNVYTEGVPDPSHPDLSNSLCGCECYYLGRKCGPKSEFCCAHMAGSKFAYTLAGKVRVPPGTPIYECNAKCSCPSDCSNRIVQLGRKIPLCIFRTKGRGWGVRTTEPIKPNTFVTEYVGEVITNEEAERRGRTCDAQGITYLFDLDFEDENSAFTVDAAKYGNISHFFNHSCDPNLVVYSVWIDTLDKRLPRLAFFTTKSISTGEELTFDYQMNRNRDYTNGSGSRMPCLCGSKNCLGYID